MSIEAADVVDHIAGSRRGAGCSWRSMGWMPAGRRPSRNWLAEALRLRGRSTQVIHADDFMHVRSVRHRRGRNSPEGYFYDSYDYESLSRYVLDPLSEAPSDAVRRQTNDHDRRGPVPAPR